MSAEGITDAVARHLKEQVAGIKAAYSTNSTGTANIEDIPDAIADTPVAIVTWDRFDLVRPGSLEQIRDFITADVYFDAQSADAAYRALVPMVTLVRQSFRNNVSLYETCTMARCASGGPHDAVAVNGVPLYRLPFVIEAFSQVVTSYQSIP